MSQPPPAPMCSVVMPTYNQARYLPDAVQSVLARACRDFDPGLRAVEDYDLYLRMSLLCDFEPVGRPTGLRRRHPGCLSRASGYGKMLEAEVLRRFAERGGGKDRLDAALVRRRLGKLYRAAGKEYFKSRCYRSALEALRAARPYSTSFQGWLVGLLSRILLPLGRSDSRELPRLREPRAPLSRRAGTAKRSSDARRCPLSWVIRPRS